MKHPFRLIPLLLSIVSLFACASLNSPNIDATPAIKAQADIPEDELLDVGIVLFDPGIPEDAKQLKEKGIFAQVRKAEARYLPYSLKTTLEDTGHWGAVRVVPTDKAAVDVLIAGEIIASDGETLSMAITVRDASARLWLSEEYTVHVDENAYSEPKLGNEDPFQAIYNSIANDILEARNRLTKQDIHTLRTISELRFASDLFPHYFGEHLRMQDQQWYTINRLPAQDDPMLQRIRKIRERDYMLIDTLDLYYAEFYRDMAQPYRDWRKNSLEERMALREVQRSANQRLLLGAATIIAGLFGASQNNQFISTAGTFGVIGGAAVFKSGLDRQAESKIHVQAMEELGESFQAEVEPLVVDVEGKTLTLSGSAEAQYEQWRELLRRIYATETGFDIIETQDSNAASQQQIPADSGQEPQRETHEQ